MNKYRAWTTADKWETGTVLMNGNAYGYTVKKYEEPSEKYGIEGGRISKLSIRDKSSGRSIVNYDRGWNIEPETEEAQLAYMYLVKKYN